MKNFNRNPYDIFYLSLMMLGSLVVWYFLNKKFGNIGTDGAYYAILGKNFVEGKGLTLWGEPHIYLSPFFSIIIGLIYLFVKNLETSAFFANLFFGLSSIPLFYLLVRKIFSRRVALLAAFLLSSVGNIIWLYSVLPTAIISASFLSILISLLVLNIVEIKELKVKEYLLLIVLGVISACAYLNRPEYFFIFIFILFLIFFSLKTFSIKKRVLILSVLIISFSTLFFPYMNFLHKNTGNWTLSGRTKIQILLSTGYDNETIADPEIIFEQEAVGLDRLLINYKAVLKKLFEGLLNIERNILLIFGFLGIFFISFGLKEIIFKKYYLEIVLFVIFLSLIPLIAIGNGGEINYTVQFLFIFLILLALGFLAFLDELAGYLILNDFKKKIILLAILSPLAVYLFFPVIQNYLFQPESYKSVEQKIMGLWLKSNFQDLGNETIVARKPDVSFYAEANFKLIPNFESTYELVDYMKENKFKFLIADDRYLKKSRPQYSDLLDGYIKIGDLKLMHFLEFNGQRIFLYGINL